MKKESELEEFRTRWKRWLGNKTRENKFTWITLIDTNWSGWVDKTLHKHNIEAAHMDWKVATREEVKEYWLKAIEAADMDDLQHLDALYADDLYNKAQ